MPAAPGVYIFKNTLGQILYVGKAKQLKVRVRSYFQPPIKLEPKTARLVSQIASLEWIEVGSEIESLLLESRLINKFQPPYNLISKDDKSPFYIHITHEKFPHPTVNHISHLAIAGPFLNSQTPRRILRHFRRIAPYCTARQPKRPCLYSHLGLCCPCPGSLLTIEQFRQYQSNITRLRRLLRGHFKSVKADLTRLMKSASHSQNYEAAALARNHLLAMGQLFHTPILPEEYLVNPNLTQDLRQQAQSALAEALAPYMLHPFPSPNLGEGIEGRSMRIEMYDVANLSGTSATGAMVVAIDGELVSRAYRHFTIKFSSKPNDVAMLKEVLTRRLKRTDWPIPDLIVLDGGKSQLSIVNWSIPTISLAKQQEIIIIPTPEGFSEIRLPKNHPGLQLLQHLRDEAHRFSRRLHHKHRSQNLTMS